jgi:putative DNA primase/helicase
MTSEIGEELIDSGNCFARDKGGRLYLLENGVYRPAGDFVARKVKRHTRQKNDRWFSKLVREVVEYLLVDAEYLWDEPPRDIINCQNCHVRLRQKRTQGWEASSEDHSKDFLSTIQLPVEYNPRAQCRRIEEFISQVFPDGAEELFWELAGMLMVPTRSYQKAILLYGEGGNGKSTVLQLLKAFLGRENVCELSLHSIEKEKFGRVRLLGKLVNICADLPGTRLPDVSTFKRLTGGDAIEAQYKFHDVFEFQPFARLIFSANTYPRCDDSSTAYFDRWDVIPFERRFRGGASEIPQQKLLGELTTPRELSGLLNNALRGLLAFRSRGDRFDSLPTLRTSGEQFHAATDPLAAWLVQHLVAVTDAVISKDELRARYKEDCRRQNRPEPSQKALTQALQATFPQVTTSQRTISGRLQPCYSGVGFRGVGVVHEFTTFMG